MSGNQRPDDGDGFFDNDVPWADATIRRNYEASLGAFILAFNQLDNLLGKILRITLTSLGRADLIVPCVNNATFSGRICLLDILKHSTEGSAIADVPIGQLRGVAGERNTLAHAHFEENPFSGEYWLVGKDDHTVQTYSAARINSASERVGRVWNALRLVQARYDFAGVVPPPAEPALPNDPEGRHGA